MNEETKKRIAEIKEREKLATMKPWIASGDRYLPDILAPDDSRRVVAQIYGTIPWDDAEFIAHARQDVPFLLDALEKAHAEIVRLTREPTEDRCEKCDKLRTTNGWNDTRDGDALCWCASEEE